MDNRERVRELDKKKQKEKKEKKKKKRETYFVGRKIGKFKEAVRKRRNANKVEVSGSEKKTEQEHIVLLFF